MPITATFQQRSAFKRDEAEDDDTTFEKITDCSNEDGVSIFQMNPQLNLARNHSHSYHDWRVLPIITRLLLVFTRSSFSTAFDWIQF